MDPASVDPDHCENTDGNQWNYEEVKNQDLWLNKLGHFFISIIISSLSNLNANNCASSHSEDALLLGQSRRKKLYASHMILNRAPLH